MTDVLTPLPDGGTAVEVRVARPKPRERKAFEPLMLAVGPMIEQAVTTLQEVLRAEADRQQAERSAAPEPDVSASHARYAIEPVRAVAGHVDSTGSRSSSG